MQKECYYKKNNKDPELAGKLKEVITQVSHCKKWPRTKTKKGWLNSYSLLQDHYFKHMSEAGFLGFERGERGSTAEHLSVLEYKTQQETGRAAAMAAVVEEKQETAAALDAEIEGKEQAAADLDKETAKKAKQLEGINKKTAVAKKEAATCGDIDEIGKKKNWRGEVALMPDDWKKVSNLAKEGVKSRSIIANLKKQITDFLKRITGLEKELGQYKGMGISESMRYYSALQRAPRRLAEVVADIMRKPPEQPEARRIAPERNRNSHAR